MPIGEWELLPAAEGEKATAQLLAQRLRGMPGLSVALQLAVELLLEAGVNIAIGVSEKDQGIRLEITPGREGEP